MARIQFRGTVFRSRRLNVFVMELCHKIRHREFDMPAQGKDHSYFYCAWKVVLELCEASEGELNFVRSHRKNCSQAKIDGRLPEIVLFTQTSRHKQRNYPLSLP